MLERFLLKAMQADLILNFIVSQAVMADSFEYSSKCVSIKSFIFFRNSSSVRSEVMNFQYPGPRLTEKERTNRQRCITECCDKEIHCWRKMCRHRFKMTYRCLLGAVACSSEYLT